jgi:hypothetical protein
MGRLGEALRALMGKRKGQGGGFEHDGDRGKILQALIHGKSVGGQEAVAITGSHNGPRRLNNVKQRLRLNYIAYVESEHVSRSSGKRYKVTWLLPEDRRKAKELFSA